MAHILPFVSEVVRPYFIKFMPMAGSTMVDFGVPYPSDGVALPRRSVDDDAMAASIVL